MSSNESSPHSTPAETDCLICGSGKSFTKNQILFCDGPGCDIPVHQKCYGVKVVPEGNWYCQRCEDRIAVDNTKSGAFKRSTIPNQYIHVACARLHPSLDENADPIAFDPSLAAKNTCCLCKSDYGICSECSVDSCTRVLHVTCAQNEGLTTKGKNTSLFCDLHRDIGALSRIMRIQQRKETQSSTPSSSGSTNHRSTKRSKSYRESSTDTEDYDGDDYESDSDEEMQDPAIEDESEDNSRMNKSAQSSSSSSRGNSRLKRSSDITERRRRERSSESEEIDVDDSEAVLGSSTGGGSSSAQRKKLKTLKPVTKESPAESQRKRLLMSLDKSKKKQGVSALNNVNLSNLPIRTLGGIGVAASTPVIGSSSSSGSSNGSETKQKLPGISRYNSINNNNTNNSGLGIDSVSNPYATSSNISPSLGSLERFPGNGNGQNHSRGSSDGSGKNLKGLTFNLDSGIDASNFKIPSPLSVSASPSPSFSSGGSPVHARLGDKQQQSPKSGSSDESREMQATIRSLQGKIANYESTIQAMNTQIQQLQQQLANPANTSAAPSVANTANSTSKGISPLALAKPHTIGPPGQDLQYRFDELQHTHTEEKKRNSVLRQNLRDVFGFLQVPVGQSAFDGVVELNADRLDDYVQALRDTMVGSDSAQPPGTSARPALDVKRRDLVVDRVLKEMGS
ncbi:Protein Jade-1 [Entomortierella chlamydospora]|uniref:Protein Jade-1 n=1 Tax=Entomortierella chlamydospora TaxID=101097 RepID=A0A9P6T4W0_9FUNG|nr:Protein Jade-1 [Entomortierella chlamydospora]KAG0024845.1 Protein Jade-1 [Entomortierella chlamydospora]